MARLSDHLKSTEQTQEQFAKRIGTTQATVSRICAGRIPSRELMAKIFEETDGAVTPNDFYGVEAASTALAQDSAA